MKRKYIFKLLAGALVAISTVLVTPMCANAEWRQNSSGWWYADGNSYYTGWKLIDGKWYYFSYEGYMQTGWAQYINEDSNGNIVGSTYYFLNSDGSMDDTKTTNTRPEELQRMYDKLIKFEPGMADYYGDLYLQGKLNDLGMSVINQIKPNFGPCYEFTVISKYGDGSDGLFYNNNTGGLVILDQGNFFIADTNESYTNLSEKCNYLNKIRNWTRTQRDYSSFIYDIKEERNCFVIDKYSYNYKSDYVGFVKSYVYDKVSGEIKF